MKARARRRIAVRNVLFYTRHYVKWNGELGVIYGFSLYCDSDPLPEVDTTKGSWKKLRSIPKPNLLRKK